MVERQKDLSNNILKEDSNEIWKEEWKDMPEFVQEDKIPFKQIIVNFNDEEGLKKFSEAVGQKVTKKTKSIFFPKRENEKPRNYLFVYLESKKDDT